MGGVEARHRTTLATELEKRSFVRVLRSHPEWSLRSLLVFLRDRDPELTALGDLTIGDVIAESDARQLRLSEDEGPMLDLERLHQGQRVRGRYCSVNPRSS